MFISILNCKLISLRNVYIFVGFVVVLFRKSKLLVRLRTFECIIYMYLNVYTLYIFVLVSPIKTKNDCIINLIGEPGMNGLPGLPGMKGEEGMPGMNGFDGPRGKYKDILFPQGHFYN